MTDVVSPDGTLRIETSRSSTTSGGSPGMGHDMDDYFDITATVTVREVATGRVVCTRSWTSGYDANSQVGGWVPTTFAFTDDGRAVIARYGDGTVVRVDLP